MHVNTIWCWLIQFIRHEAPDVCITRNLKHTVNDIKFEIVSSILRLLGVFLAVYLSISEFQEEFSVYNLPAKIEN